MTGDRPVPHDHAKAAPAAPAPPAEGAAEQVQYSQQSLHEVMEQQIKEILARADLSEEQKQAILVALQCPCCGSGGVSLSVKLKS